MKAQKTGEILEKMDELEKPEPVRKSKPMPSAKARKRANPKAAWASAYREGGLS